MTDDRGGKPAPPSSGSRRGSPEVSRPRDRFIIEGIEAECRLGVYEWEQEKPQPIWIDLELAIDAKRASARDDMRDAVDYAALVASVREEAQRRPIKLLETLTETIASLVLEQFGTPWVRVRVKKRALPGIGYAAVEVERTVAARRPVRRLRAAVGR